MGGLGLLGFEGPLPHRAPSQSRSVISPLGNEGQALSIYQLSIEFRHGSQQQRIPLKGQCFTSHFRCLSSSGRTLFWHFKGTLELQENAYGVCTSLVLLCLSYFLYPASIPVLGSQHHVDKALNLIGKKFKELNLTNIYAPPLPSLALPSLPMTSWVSMLLEDQDFLSPFLPNLPQTTNS